MKGATTDRRVTTSIIAGLALVALIVHLLTIHRYGYFRDELYYIACARHLDFGYVVLAILVTPQRRLFAQKWIWLGGLIALVIALPNIIWQMERGWPTWVLLHGIAKSNKNVVLSPWEFFFQQITLMNPATFPVWFGGLIWLLVSHEGRRYRVIAFTYLTAFTEFVVMHGKNYYLAPAYPMLFAAGGVAFEGIFALRMRWLKPAIAFLVVASAAVFAPVVLPILSPEKLLAYMRAIHFEAPRTETSHTAALPQLFADQFGWEEMVRSVAQVYASLSANEQKLAAIFCQNYGEAGAIDFFGPKYGLPPALSGHQNYFYWGPGNYTGEIMIVLDDDATDEREQFRSVEDRGMVESSPWAMPWEQRLHIFVCRDLKIPLRELWPKLRVWL